MRAPNATTRSTAAPRAHQLCASYAVYSARQCAGRIVVAAGRMTGSTLARGGSTLQRDVRTPDRRYKGRRWSGYAVSVGPGRSKELLDTPKARPDDDAMESTACRVQPDAS